MRLFSRKCGAEAVTTIATTPLPWIKDARTYQVDRLLKCGRKRGHAGLHYDKNVRAAFTGVETTTDGA